MAGVIATGEGFSIARLTPPGDASLQALLEAGADFEWLVMGAPVSPTAARDLFDDFPETCAVNDRHVLGVLAPDQRLVGVLSCAANYRQAGEWYLGLMLLAPDQRGHGLGARIYQAFEAWVRGQGATRLLLSVVEPNTAALRFWQTVGFRMIRTRPPERFGQKEHVCFELECAWAAGAGQARGRSVSTQPGICGILTETDEKAGYTPDSRRLGEAGP